MLKFWFKAQIFINIHKLSSFFILRVCLLYAVEAQTSLDPLSWFHGSCVTTAHAHQCCIFQSYAKTLPSWMKLTMREPASMTTVGHVITPCDVWLQQHIALPNMSQERMYSFITAMLCNRTDLFAVCQSSKIILFSFFAFSYSLDILLVTPHTFVLFSGIALSLSYL